MGTRSSRLRIIQQVALAVLLAASLLACSSGSNGGPPDASPTANVACQDYASSYCARLADCSPSQMIAQFGSSDVCVERTAHYCAVALAAPDTGVTSSVVDACGQAMAGESCADLLTENDPAECKAPTGSRPALQNDPAAVCVFGSQCASGSCVGAGNMGASSDCGICYGSLGGDHLGDPCSGAAANGANVTMPLFHDDLLAFHNECSNGLACSGPASGPYTCQPAGHQGDTCDSAHPCAPDLLCDNGHCGPLHREGEPCPDPEDCDGYHLFACGTDGKCHAQAVVPPGGTIVDDGWDSSVCGSAGHPVTSAADAGADAGTDVSVCTPPTPDGQPCDPANDTCLAPAGCVEGICQVPDPSVGTCNGTDGG